MNSQSTNNVSEVVDIIGSSPSSLGKLNVVMTDIFTEKRVMMHCVSGDFKMSKGIARLVSKIYEPNLQGVRCAPGSFAVTQDGGRTIIHLVTKNFYYQKPKHLDFLRSLERAYKWLVQMGLDSVSIPELGSGLDKLPRAWVQEHVALYSNNYGVNTFLHIPHFNFMAIMGRGDRRDYYTLYEFKTHTRCCQKVVSACECLSIQHTNRFFMDILDFVVLNYYKPVFAIPHAEMKREIYRDLNDLEMACASQQRVVGVTGFGQFRHLRPVYYGEQVSEYLPVNFANGRECFNHIMSNPAWIYSNYYISVAEPEMEMDSTTTDSESESENAPDIVKSVEERLVIHSDVVLRKPKNRTLERINMLRSRGSRVRNRDYDSYNFALVISSNAEVPKPGVLAPTCMKIKFAKEFMARSRLVTPNSPPNFYPLEQYCRYRFARGHTLRKTLNICDDFDSFLYKFFEEFVEGGLESALRAMYFLYRELGIYGDRQVWYHLASLFKIKGVPDYYTMAKNYDVVKPVVIPGRPYESELPHFRGGVLSTINDLGMHNFVRFTMLFHDFRNWCRIGTGRAPRNIAAYPNVLISTYLCEYTTFMEENNIRTSWTPTMFSAVGDIHRIANTVEKVDTESINEAIRVSQGTMHRMNMTMDRLGRLVNDTQAAGLTELISSLSDIAQKTNAFLDFLTTPLMDKAMDHLQKFLNIPASAMVEIKKRITVVNMATITGLFVLYQHTDSTLLRCGYLTCGLHLLGFLGPARDLLVRFCAGFRKFFDGTEEPQPTNIASQIFDVITHMVGGAAGVAKAVVSGVYAMVSTKVPSYRTMARLMDKFANTCKNINFTFLGLNALPKLWELLGKAFLTVKNYITGEVQEPTPQDAWLKKFDKWRILLHVLEDPRINDLLRVNETVRKESDKLYEDGVELLRESTSLNVRRESVTLSNLMRRAKQIADSVSHYRSYTSQRVTPYVICLTSEAGTGKTNLVHILKHLAGKYLYPGIDEGALLYNVPMDVDHLDGYSKQKMVVLDDYNLVEDPAWVARITPFISNLSKVIPMAHLEDKGIVLDSDIVVQTTNSPYHVPVGVLHADAVLRRRNKVVYVLVDPKYKKDGRVDKATIIKERIKELKKDRTLAPHAENFYEEEAKKFYDDMGYYTFQIMGPMNNTVMKTLTAQKFFTYILKDFLEHRRREASLLEQNNTPPLDEDITQLMTTYTAELEHLRQTVDANKTLFERYLAEQESVRPEHQPLYDRILGMSTANRIRFMNRPQEFLRETTDWMRTVLSAVNMNNIFQRRMGGSLEGFVEETLIEVEAQAHVDGEVPEEDEEDAPVPTMDEGIEVDEARFTTRVVGDDFIVDLDLDGTYNFDFEQSSEPPLGWLSMDFFNQRVAREGERGPNLPTCMATDFALLLRLDCDNRAEVEYVSDVLGEDPNIVDPQWYLRYPNNNFGTGSFQMHKTEGWFLESYATFLCISDQQRFDVIKRIQMVEREYLGFRERLTPVIQRVVEERAVRASWWTTFAKYMGTTLLIACMLLLYICLYIGILLWLSWLLRPTGTATQYNVNPRKASGRPLNWVTTMDVANVRSLRRRLEANCQLVGRREKNGALTVAQIFYVHGTYALIPKHFLPTNFTEIELVVTSPEFPDIEEGQSYFLPRANFYPLPEKDVVLVNFGFATRCHKSALKYFVNEADLPHIITKQIMILQRERETSQLLMATTEVTGSTEISLPGCDGVVRECVFRGSAPAGSSGGVVYSLDANTPSLIYGFQSASTKTWGCFTPVTREELQQLIEKASLPVYEEIDLDEEIYPCDSRVRMRETKIGRTPIEEIFGNVNVVGLQSKQNSPVMMTKTSFRESPIAHELPPVHREPAILSDWDPRWIREQDQRPHYLSKSMSKFSKDMVPGVAPSELKPIIDAITTYNRNTNAFNNLRVLTIKEAVQADHLDSCRMDLTTSPGLPWLLRRGRFKGKTSHIQRDLLGEITFISPEFTEACEEFLEKLRSNIVPTYLQNDCMKDELRDSELGKQFSTRIITVMPMHVTTVARQLMLDYHSRIHSLAKNANIISVGVNMDSLTSRLMLDKICSKSEGRYCIDFDVSNWDGHFAGWLAEALVEIRNNIYAEGLNSSESDLVARRNLYLSMIFGYVQLDRVVYKKFRGMSSGFCGTAEDNSEAHLILIYLIWRRIFKEYPSFLSFQVFLQSTTIFLYGDDIILSVSEEILPFFNGITIAEHYRQLGWPVTPASKGATIMAYKHWSEISFLKRSFVRMHGMVYAPLEEETIKSLLSWTRGESLQQFYSNLRDVFTFLVSHGEAKFDVYFHNVQLALRRALLPQMYENFDDMHRIHMSAYDSP